MRDVARTNHRICTIVPVTSCYEAMSDEDWSEQNAWGKFATAEFWKIQYAGDQVGSNDRWRNRKLNGNR